ncbi:Hypothetical protein PHPALM_4692 [Phytophthora palmivora]|uniref:Uncharacterized protein n=1 Tax=Phytophthora palmivora TaxID=4796 RepID=A0A2P4YJE2_9STRA|nr:Hypothetical protein PHPALM_4692 [Phytophthora palmivora]
MTSERARSALPQELLVAHDERHSYMQRMHSLAGPGAYTIPSTFKRRSPNMLLRVVQRENYGREFASASCQLSIVTAVDTHRARRDQLRKLLHLSSDGHASSPVAANVADSRTSSPRTASPESRRLPSSRASSPSGRMSADIADIVADFGEQPAVEEQQPGDDVVQLQVCAFSSPPTYQHFLMSTSYLDRLRKQRRRAASQ